MAKILFVDDDAGYLELAAAVLSARHKLTLASTAEDAAEKLDQGSFDLVISDINMFGMTGFELLGKLKREGKSQSCPVILCSGQSDPETKNAALKQGAAGFLSKPFSLEQFEAMVAATLKPKA